MVIDFFYYLKYLGLCKPELKVFTAGFIHKMHRADSQWVTMPWNLDTALCSATSSLRSLNFMMLRNVPLLLLTSPLLCSSRALSGSKSIQMQSFHSAQQSWRAKLPTPAFCFNTKHRRFSPSKATSREIQPNNKAHPFKTMLKACGDATSSSHFSLLCPPMPSTFSNSVLFTSDFTMNPQSTRAGNPTQKTYSGWEIQMMSCP